MESLNWPRLSHDGQSRRCQKGKKKKKVRDTPLTALAIITGLAPALSNVNYAQQVELLVPPLWGNVNIFSSQVWLEQCAHTAELRCDLIGRPAGKFKLIRENFWVGWTHTWVTHPKK